MIDMQAQSISGTVYFDGNNNGNQDSLETGFANVAVNAYRAGTLVTSSMTAADGSYNLSSGIQVGINYRLEFILPPGYNDGAVGSGSNSSVQFVLGGSSSIAMGIYVPSLCGSVGTATPRILAGCIPFVGDVSLASNPYANHSAGRLTCSLSPHRDDLTKNEIGVPFALAVHKRQKLAFLTTLSTPNQADFPPAPDGASAIYVVNYSGPDFTYQSYKLLVRLSDLGIDVSSQFPLSAAEVNIGEYGLGGLAISEDERYLYLLNMGKGNIIRLDISALNYQTIPIGGFTSPGQLPITEIEIPPAISNCINGRFRPSVLRMNAGKLYIGGICDASVSTDNTGLYAKIIEMNPETGSSRIVFSHDLTTFRTGDLEAANLPQVRWQYPIKPSVADGNPGEKQPFFSDLGFDDTGSIIFSIVDRKVFSILTNRETGYLVRTWRLADGTFELESDRQSGPFTSAALISHTFSTQPSNLLVDNGGPGTIQGPKWFFEQGIDLYDPSPGVEHSYFNHVNLANGGIYILPGTKEVVVGFTDPGCASTSGMRYFDWTNGTTKYGVNLSNIKYFSITGINAVCDPAPIEIGNYVWKDSNRDGIQDPEEPPLAGVTIGLFKNCSGDPIATALTDVNGTYYFSSAAGSSTPSRIYGLELQADSAYCLKILSLGTDPGVTGLQLAAVSPVLGETATGPNSTITLSNNDAFVVAGLPTISIPMGHAGQNNHTYDFGLIDLPCSLTAGVAASACDPTTNTYSTTVTASIANAALPDTITISQAGITRSFATITGRNTITTVFSGLVPDGGAHTVLVSQPTCGSALLTFQAPTACQPRLSLAKFVDRSIVNTGDTLTYSLVLSNVGPVSTAMTVRDSLSKGLTLLRASASVPIGTRFTPGQPVSLWDVPTIAAGQSLTLTFQVRADTVGIVTNTATIPGDTVTVCTPVRIQICAGSSFTLVSPVAQPAYQWYKDGLLLPGATTNSFVVTEPGAYSLDQGSAGIVCAGPFIVETLAQPTFQALAQPNTCLGALSQNDGQLKLSDFTAGYTYQYSTGNSFDPLASLPGTAQLIPTDGILTTALSNPTISQPYTIRVYSSQGCYADKTVTLTHADCRCPTPTCAKFSITIVRRPTPAPFR
jgi:uncharacterized repeat protein (TIGR01451 family)